MDKQEVLKVIDKVVCDWTITENVPLTEKSLNALVDDLTDLVIEKVGQNGRS